MIEFYNDASMIPYYLLVTIWFCAIMILSILVHELGHLIMLRKYNNRKVKLRFEKMKFLAGEQEDYDNLTTEQYLNVNAVGVWLGLTPILILGIWFNVIWLLAIPYAVGCRQDLQEIFKHSK